MPRVRPSSLTQAKALQLALRMQELLRLRAIPPALVLAPPDQKAGKTSDEASSHFSFDAKTFITTVNLKKNVKSARLADIPFDRLFQAVVAAASPDQWGAVAKDFFSSLVVGRENKAGDFVPQAPVQKGNGSWDPGYLLQEVVEWHWTPELATRIHNLLGVDHDVDARSHTITTKFWLYRCDETEIFDTTIAGGLDVDRGEIITTVEPGSITVQATKELRFTDRVDIEGTDALALGRLLNYSAGAIVFDWMSNVFEAFETALRDRLDDDGPDDSPPPITQEAKRDGYNKKQSSERPPRPRQRRPVLRADEKVHRPVP